MRKVVRILMVLLSYAPIATVAVAAQAKASEIDGEDQNTAILKIAREARFRLMPDGHTNFSIEDSKKRYSELTGLDGADLEERMNNDIHLLVNKGLIQLNEKNLMSAGPSQYSMK